VEETIYLVDDEEQGDEVRTVKKQSEMLFLRGMHTSPRTTRIACNASLIKGAGDSVVLISPQQ